MQDLISAPCEGRVSVTMTAMNVTGRMVLDVPLDEEDPSGASTVGGYLLALLLALWQQGEYFSSKRPFGYSSWQGDIRRVLGDAGLIPAKRDREKETARLIALAIAELGRRE